MMAIVALTGDLTFQTARIVQPQLVAALSADADAEIDLSRVAAIDTAGLQMLIAAKHEAIAQHKTLRFFAHSNSVLDVLLLFDLVEPLWRLDRVAKKTILKEHEIWPPRDRAIALPTNTNKLPAPTANENVVSENWHLSLRFGTDVLRRGIDPQLCLRHLCRYGEIATIVTLVERVPRLSFLDVEACYLGVEINFCSWADETRIASVFAFVREDSAIQLLPPRSPIAEYARLIRERPEPSLPLGEILMRCGSLTLPELQVALLLQAERWTNSPSAETRAMPMPR